MSRYLSSDSTVLQVHLGIEVTVVVYVIFKKRAAVFYRDLKSPRGFRPDRRRAASFLNGFKNIPGKACVNRVHNNYAFVNAGN